jgi:putative ABC transport system ATP-binding protein
MDDPTHLFRQKGLPVAVKNLSKSYSSGGARVDVLKRISCRIEPGTVAIIQGPSGCGKSTLLNILGGVDQPDHGDIMIGPEQLGRHRSQAELARYRLSRVGFVFQSFNLIPGLTALENLTLPMTAIGMNRAIRTQRAQALLDLVDVTPKASNRPDTLSGGEQQRVAVALALANDPSVILADEPTGNLDSANARRVTDLLCDLARRLGKTVVVTTHDPVVAARGDHVLQMRDGELQGEAGK